MSIVTLVSSGFIFKDTFDSTELGSMWEVNPVDKYSLTDVTGSLILKPSTDTVYAALSGLSSINNFVLSANISYTPQKTDDESGIFSKGETEQTLALEQKLPTSSVRPWIRIIRKNLQIYEGYTSTDGKSWSLLGTSTFSVLNPKIGFFLKSEAGSTATLNIKEVFVTTGTVVTVGNLVEGTIVKLLNQSGTTLQQKTCPTASTQVTFDVSGLSLPFTGNFSVKLPGVATEFKQPPSTNLTIWQGDIYKFETAPDIYYYNESNVKTLLQEATEKDLGYFNTGATNYKTFKMVARNNFTSGILKSVRIDTKDYGGTNQYQTLVKVAPDSLGTAGTFSDFVNLGDISPNTEKVFWLRISREDSFVGLANKVSFGLLASASF